MVPFPEELINTVKGNPGLRLTIKLMKPLLGRRLFLVEVRGRERTLDNMPVPALEINPASSAK